MYIGSGIFLLVAGAILTFAVHASVAGLDVQAIGVILMIAGLLAIVLSMVITMPRRRMSRTVVDRRSMPPAGGAYQDDYAVRGPEVSRYGDGRTVVEREDDI